MKNIWKGIRSIISLQKMTNDSLEIISLEDHTITDLQAIANTVNIFFCLVAAEVQSELSFSYKRFFEYSLPPNQDSFFIPPCTKEEIIQIISNFRPKKLTGPNSICTKILRLLLAVDISEHLSIIFNTSFATGIFPDKLKVANVIPIHKRILNQNAPTIDLSLLYVMLMKYQKN